MASASIMAIVFFCPIQAVLSQLYNAEVRDKEGSGCLLPDDPKTLFKYGVFEGCPLRTNAHPDPMLLCCAGKPDVHLCRVRVTSRHCSYEKG